LQGGIFTQQCYTNESLQGRTLLLLLFKREREKKETVQKIPNFQLFFSHHLLFKKTKNSYYFPLEAAK
jgi:hypothetical protein